MVKSMTVTDTDQRVPAWRQAEFHAAMFNAAVVLFGPAVWAV